MSGLFNAIGTTVKYLFNGPSQPKVQALPPATSAQAAPSIATPAVEARQEETVRRERRRSGRASTMLTSQENYTSPNIGTTTLLGG